jgi:TM2 domain-containing membrane protein YozV
MSKKIRIGVVLNLFFSCFLFGQTSLDRIAILNLDAVSITETESITLTERLRSELVNSGSFLIIERSEMDEILKEQGFQQTGCTTDECAVEIGKLLNINRICAGSVGKVGSVYTVTLHMIDVETGQILVTVTEDCQCPIELVLTTSMKNITKKLVDASKEYVRPIIGGKGDIYIKSEPSAALVYIDGKSRGMTTPTTIRDLETGEHLIKVVKGELVGSKIIRVSANKIHEESIYLGKAKGGIKVYSTPVEANIYIGEKFYGRTPKIISDLSIGDHLVTLKKSGYLDINQNITISGGDYAIVEGNLVKPASLNITSIPTNAIVRLRGKQIDKTPISINNQYPEKVYVEVSFPGYQTERKYLDLKEAYTTNEAFKLKKSPSLIVDSNPSESSVFINDKFIGTTPLSIDSLTDARIKLSLKKMFYKDWQKTLILQSGKDEKLNIDLTAKKCKVSITSTPDSAIIELNGINIGTTPVDEYLVYGEYSLSIFNPKFKTINEKLVIGKPVINKNYELIYKKGQLILSNLTPGSNVFINGHENENGFNEISVPIGIHLIKIEKFGYESKIFNYISQENQTKSFDGMLQKKTSGNALWRSIVFPGWGQFYQEKPIQTLVYPFLFVSGIGVSYLMINNYNKSVDDYDAAREIYLKAFSEEDIIRTRSAMNEAYDDVESKEKTRNIAFIATGVIWLWNVVDTMIIPPEYEDKIEVSTNIKKNKIMAGVQIRF